MGFIKHFKDDFTYNFTPEGFSRENLCCDGMKHAFKVGGIEVLSNYKYVVIVDYGCIVLSFCPWCCTDLRVENAN